MNENKLRNAWNRFKSKMTETTEIRGPVWLLDFVIPYFFGGGIAAFGIMIASWISGIRYAPYSIHGIGMQD